MVYNMQSKLINFCILFLCFITIMIECADYVTYIKTEDNKFEPVMESVSSTIEPIPMYKIAHVLSYDIENPNVHEKNKLITVSNVHSWEKKSKHYDTNKAFVKIEPIH